MGQHDGARLPCAERMFLTLLAAHAAAARTYAQHLVRRSQLSAIDAEDLFALGVTKVWRTYFSAKAHHVYQHQSQQQALGLIKAALRTTALDLVDKYASEAERFRWVELDAPDFEQRFGELPHDEDFTQWVDLRLDLEQFIETQLTPREKDQLMADLTGNRLPGGACRQAGSAQRVARHRVRQRLRHFLATYAL